VTQGVGPEFKPHYWKKKKEEEEMLIKKKRVHSEKTVEMVLWYSLLKIMCPYVNN
jgi:hypothetical protein